MAQGSPFSAFEKLTEGVRVSRAGEGGYVTDMPQQGGEVRGDRRSAAGAHPVSDSYTNVRIAARELESVIANGRGLPNRELDALAKSLRELADKYRIGGGDNA